MELVEEGGVERSDLQQLEALPSLLSLFVLILILTRCHSAGFLGCGGVECLNQHSHCGGWRQSGDGRKIREDGG